MTSGDSVFCVLWTSRLSPLMEPGAVVQIWRSSGERSQRLGLTGAMLFDGERFCELLEGEASKILAVCRDIEFDTRHVGMRMLYAASNVVPRQRADWCSRYCEGFELEIFSGPGALEGEPALDAFLTLLPRCDLTSGSRKAPTHDGHLIRP